MQDRTAIRQTLLELIEADTGQTFGSLDDQANLKEQLGLDSVDVVSIVMQVENRFRIRLGHEELQQVVTVGNLLDLMQAKLAQGPETAAA